MKEDKVYNLHFKTLVKDVSPIEDINHLVNIFIMDSATMMGSNFTKETLELVTQMVKDEYGRLPVYYIAMAFKKGALGKLGIGRLVGATVHRWLSEITLEYYKDLDKKRLESEDYDPNNCADLHKYPTGKAIIQKINWWKSDKLDGDLWDRVNLHELAEAIGKGEHIQFNNFYR
jgi:hypothetical protein